jgi:hypothetical protein
MKYKIMIKTHSKTKLKYLCVTHNEDYEKYKGSGLYWKNHLKIHGSEYIDTELLYETECKEELRNKGLYYSSLYDVVESSEWANLIPETGYDYDGITRDGWFGWYNSLSDAEIKQRNLNISAKVRERYANEDPEKISKEQRNRRLNMSPEAKERRKKKIQEVWATGKHDHLFERYSKERQGSNNPGAVSVTIEGVAYGSIKEACDDLGLTRSMINTRLNSTSERWKEWVK